VAFIRDPSDPGARLYRTGDRAQVLPSGDIDFLGRLDHQVKLRGFRIELGEIERALYDHPAVRAAVVLCDRERLIAFVVGDADAAALAGHLRATLPEHMVPSAFAQLDALPLTRTGKVDRRALASIVPSAEPKGASAPPSTPAERAIAAIWGEVLSRGEIGVDDRFFEIGGHSLLATQVVARVRRAFGVDLPLRALFEAPTIRELARVVSAAHVADEARLDALLARIDQLTEEEAAELLAASR